jgi:fido (protein-threonine AMPylation protein)
MSFKRKPKILEQLDDDLFQQLPPDFRLMEEGAMMDMEFADCDYYGTIMVLHPFPRPISRVLAHPQPEEAP